MRSATVLLLLFGFAACGGAESRSTAEHAGKVTGPGTGESLTDCSDWRSWVQMNDRRFRSKGHGGKWVDVYVEPAFGAAYLDRSHPAPRGMRVIKAGYRDDAGTQFEALTVMVKMEPGYDPEHGDWYYGVLAADGTSAKMQGRLDTCIGCHHEAAEQDYLFGLP